MREPKVYYVEFRDQETKERRHVLITQTLRPSKRKVNTQLALEMINEAVKEIWGQDYRWAQAVDWNVDLGLEDPYGWVICVKPGTGSVSAMQEVTLQSLSERGQEGDQP